MTTSRRDLIHEICFNAMIAALYAVLTVGVGELAVMVLGYIFFILIKRSKMFMHAFEANQNLDCKF